MVRLLAVGFLLLGLVSAGAFATFIPTPLQRAQQQREEFFATQRERLARDKAETDEIVAELQSCASRKNMHLDSVAPYGLSHPAALTLAYCYLSLPPKWLCNRKARSQMMTALQSYYLGRDRAVRLLAAEDNQRRYRNSFQSSIDAETRVAQQTEAQSWVGDDDLARRLADVVRAGYLNPDDVRDYRTHADIVQTLGGIPAGRDACAFVAAPTASGVIPPGVR